MNYTCKGIVLSTKNIISEK